MIFQHAIWHYPELNSEQILALSHSMKCDPLIAQLLIERGIDNAADAQSFLAPDIRQLHDPFLLKDMDKACEKIKLSIKNSESIWIYGDYDVDGITSISILCKYFEHIGYPVRYYIPSRQEEGYGLSAQGLDHIKSQGGQLIITVDCGITAVEQVAYAKKIGLDMIITDHHECQETLPLADAVINPKRGGYPFDMLAGCGVAIKLVQAMMGEDFFDFYPQVIDIVALGTVADIVPLIDENRIFTKIGLEYMMHTSNPGVQALIAEAQLTGKEINAGHIGFVIAPRINASGRIGNPSIAVEMLLEKEYFSALEIAKGLSALNAERQAQEREIMDAAEAYIQQFVDLEREKILLVVGENWHTGIIGIVASKLSDKYARPTVVLNIEEGTAKGSARSIEGISIYGVLNAFKHLFEKFGGHEQAAGLSLSVDNVPLLKEALIAYGEKHIPWRILVHQQKVSGYLKPQMITHKLVEDIERLKPFGMGNPKPQFVFNDLNIDDYKVIGKGQNHLKLIVNDGTRVYDALAFNQSDVAAFIHKKDNIHLLINLEKNYFMGVETIQFLIKDFVKDKMPFKKDIQSRAYEAIFRFILNDHHILGEKKYKLVEKIENLFTRHMEIEAPLFIFDLEALALFKNEVMKSNEVRYALHFNELNPQDAFEGVQNVIFMPYEKVQKSVENASVLKADSMDNRLNGFIPNRDDLAYFYKQLIQLKSRTLEEMTSKIRMNEAKIKCCLILLKEMQLIDYTIFNGYINCTVLPKPSEKINIESLKIYNRMSNRA